MAGAAFLSGQMCVAKPELTVGPYYVDVNLNRSDLRTDARTGEARPGIPLELSLAVSRIAAGACTPLVGALVDVWHCDALGIYSGVNDRQFGNTLGQTWLRGHQIAGAEGTVRFLTTFPGWYPGRASHIHFTVRSAAAGQGAYDFTSQLFFPEEMLASIYTTKSPYAQKGDNGRTSNARDGIFGQGGAELLLNPAPKGDGYSAAFSIGLVI